MTARQKAFHLWTSPLSLEEEESTCIRHGIAIITPETYLLAMPCHTSMSDSDILTHAHTHHPRHLLPFPDMLHIVHVVSEWRRLINLVYCNVTHPFPWTCYQRRGWELHRRPSLKIFRRHEQRP